MSSQLMQFDQARISAGDLGEVMLYQTSVEKELSLAKNKGSEVAYNPFAVVDAKAQTPGYLEGFTRGFNTELGYRPGKGVNFNVLNEAQTIMQYDVTGASVATTIATDILPTIEGLIRDTSLLSRMTIIKADGRNVNKQLWDFGLEQDAVFVGEVAAGTDADDVIRRNDTLLAQYKLQASTKFGEFGLSTMSPEEEGQFFARMGRRVAYGLGNAALNNGAAVANGTARNGMRGINNNYGISATGDAANQIGSINYTTKAAADALLVAASTDSYDLCVKIKRQLLPSNLDDVEESKYAYVMNRRTWGIVSSVVDGNGRFKAQSAMDPATGRAMKQIDDSDVVIFPGVADNFVFLVPLDRYRIYLYGGIVNLNDAGLVQLREGLTSYVSRVWCDGSLTYGHRYLSTTAVTAGTTPYNNAQQNYYRYFSIV